MELMMKMKKMMMMMMMSKPHHRQSFARIDLEHDMTAVTVIGSTKPARCLTSVLAQPCSCGKENVTTAPNDEPRALSLPKSCIFASARTTHTAAQPRILEHARRRCNN